MAYPKSILASVTVLALSCTAHGQEFDNALDSISSTFDQLLGSEAPKPQAKSQSPDKAKRNLSVKNELNGTYNIRSAPTLSGKKLSTVATAKGGVHLTGTKKTAADGSTWAQVKSRDGVLGWVSSRAVIADSKGKSNKVAVKRSAPEAPKAPLAEAQQPKLQKTMAVAATQTPPSPASPATPANIPAKLEEQKKPQPVKLSEFTTHSRKPIIKPELKTESLKTEEKQEPQPIELPEIEIQSEKPIVKTEAKPEAKPEVKKAQTVQESKPQTKVEAKAEAKPQPKLEPKPEPQHERECASSLSEFKKSPMLKEALGENYNAWSSWRGESGTTIVPHGRGMLITVPELGKFFGYNDTPITMEVCIEAKDKKHPYAMILGKRHNFNDGKGGSSFTLNDSGHSSTFTRAGH